jgi:DNA-binding MarR family transcriptional regulator
MNSENRRPVQPPLIIAQIGGLHITIRKECDRVFREQQFPVEMDQIPVLAVLYYNDGLSQQEICSKLQRDKASVNRTISFLSKRDMARVVQDATDKRKTRVELTTTGKELAIRADAVLKKIDAILVSTLSEKEVQQFSTLMRKLAGTSFT